MRICHFTLGSVNPNSSNGINKVLLGVNKELQKLVDDIVVVTVRKKNRKEKEIFERPGFRVVSFATLKGAIQFITKEIQFDVCHIHNVWSRENVKVARSVAKMGKPYIISAHSGLSMDRVKGSNYFIKKAFQWLWQRDMLDKADTLHALCHEEASEISAFSSNKSFKVIPNGIDSVREDVDLGKGEIEEDIIRLGFIGRIAEEKNIHSLVEALTLLPRCIQARVRLDLIGSYESNYGQKIVDFISKHNLKEQVVLHGSLYGDELKKAREKIDIYTHVSLSEGSSLSIIEAMADGKLCIFSRTSNIAYFYDSNAFIMCEPLAFDISNSIYKAVKTIDDGQYIMYSKRAVSLVENKLLWSAISKEYIEMYSAIIRPR